MSESETSLDIKDDKHSVDDEECDDSDILDDIGNIFSDMDNFTESIDPKQNPLVWVQTQIARCVNPKIIVKELVPNINLPENVPELSLWRLIFEIIAEPTPRKRLPHVSSLENVIHLIKESKNILVLTGAGVSVSCGIPDFRSRNGIYARLSQDFPDLPDPHSMFDIHFFRCNPCPFFRFAKEIYPGRFAPSLSHRFIQHLEKSGRLLRNYTQNIDTLEQVAGINNVVHCHGSFATATCMNCKVKVKAEDIEIDVFAQSIPYCKQCTPNTEGAMNILKPDIVFFGEGLPEEFHKKIEKDKDKADLLIVIGSSLKVRPVALIPTSLKPEIPQILINREQLPHMQFDVELYGNCDDVINELCCQLGKEWTHITKSFLPNPLNEKYKSFLGINNDSYDKNKVMGTKGNSSGEVDQYTPVITNGISVQEIPTHSYIIENAGHNTHTASNSNSSNNDNGNSKKSKDYVDSDSTDSKNIFYSFLPPNCYIFHGAEMECRPESEDDMDDKDHCYINTESNESCNTPGSNQTSVEMVLPSTTDASIGKGSSVAHNMSPAELPTTTHIEKEIVSIDSTSVNMPVFGENVHSNVNH